MSADLLTANQALRDCLLCILGAANRLPMADPTKVAPRPWLPAGMSEALDTAEVLLELKQADDDPDGILGYVGVPPDDPDFQGVLGRNVEQIIKTAEEA